MEKLEFKIKLSVTDLYYFMMYHYYTKPSGVLGVLLSLAAAVALCIRFSSFSDMARLVFLFVALLFTVINPILLWTKAAAQITSNTSLGGELTYELDDEKFSIRLGENAAEIPWEQVTRARDNGRELVVYVTAARGYIWPKRQIQASYEQIIQILKTHVDARKLKLKDEQA